MEIEWDENKRQRTLKERHLDFATGWRFFDGRPVINIPSPRQDELRWKTIAIIEERYYALVWTLRGEAARIISYRRAHEDEERAYREVHD